MQGALNPIAFWYTSKALRGRVDPACQWIVTRIDEGRFHVDAVNADRGAAGEPIALSGVRCIDLDVFELVQAVLCENLGEHLPGGFVVGTAIEP